MQTDALKLAELTAKSKQPERLSWGIVEFQVTDLERTLAFWTTTLGLQVRKHDGNGVAVGTQVKTLFVFRDGATQPVSLKCLGMYHVAIGVPNQYEFSSILARLTHLRVPYSPVDHLMSKAIYIADPDGLEIEIALETPERFGRFGDMSRGLVLYDSDGQKHSGRERLDINAELSYAKDTDLDASLADDAYLAHMHFKVTELDTAVSWFEAIGFARNLLLPNFGFADMGAGAAYTHRLAMNTWSGPNLSPAPDNMARVTRYELRMSNKFLAANTNDLKPSETGLTGFDPTGIQVSIVSNY